MNTISFHPTYQLPVLYRESPHPIELFDGSESYKEADPKERYTLSGWTFCGYAACNYPERIKCFEREKYSECVTHTKRVLLRSGNRIPEKRALKHLGSHRGIMAYERKCNGSDSYFVEYLPGVDLIRFAEKLHEQNDKLFTYSLLIPIFIEVAQTLTYIHSKGVTHGDLDTYNIMVIPNTSDGSFITKIVDFEFAKLRNDPKFRPYGGWRVIPPEGDKVTQETDIWYLGNTINKTFRRSLRKRTALDPDLRKFIRFCMREIPSNRPTAEQVAVELSKIEKKFNDPKFREEFAVTGGQI